MIHFCAHQSNRKHVGLKHKDIQFLLILFAQTLTVLQPAWISFLALAALIPKPEHWRLKYLLFETWTKTSYISVVWNLNKDILHICCLKLEHWHLTHLLFETWTTTSYISVVWSLNKDILHISCLKLEPRHLIPVGLLVINHSQPDSRYWSEFARWFFWRFF